VIRPGWLSGTRHELPDDLDGCGLVLSRRFPPTPDDLVPWVVLFAGLLTDAEIREREAEWRELFG
jgi:hypothetical protein